MAEKKTEKKENKVLSEISAFLTLVFIIGLVSVGGWYWYTHFYSPNKNKTNEETKEVAGDYKLNTITASGSRVLKVLNDKYIYEIDENSYDLYKVMDFDGKVIFEGREKFSEFFYGVDGNFYFIKEEIADSENVLSLYRVENNSVISIKKITEQGVFFAPVIYIDDDNEELVGFAGSKNNYNDGDYELEKTYFYNLKGEEKTADDFIFSSENVLNAVEIPFTSNNSKYFVISDDDGKKFGLLNINNFEVVIEPSYDGLYTNFDNKTFVAVRDGKAGIIDENQKKLVEFDYDFIARYDDFYVVSKDSKMAIMDSEYKLVTDFEFDYQNGGLVDMDYNYKLCCTNFNTFKAAKVGEKYILTINAEEVNRRINYNKSMTYIIKNDGTYDSINANMFVVLDDLIYSYSKSKNEYVVYDKSLTPKFSIDTSKYDYSLVPDLVRFGNTLALEGKKVYFDYETGEAIDEVRDYEYSMDNVRIQYGHEKVNVIVNDKIEHTYNFEPFEDEDFINVLDDGVYHLSKREIVILKK